MRKWFWLLLFSIMMGSANAETIRLGLAFDTERNGHGFDLHKVGDTYILFFYTYDQNGDPEWYLGVAEIKDGVISGPLDRFTYDAQSNPPQLADPGSGGRFALDWRSAAVDGACNDGVNRSGAEQAAAFYWQTGSESGVWCTQFLFGGDPAGSPYHGGVWFAGEEDSGYGFSMSQELTTEIAIVYYYDSSGQPRWALGSGESGALIDLENYKGYCRTCPMSERLVEPAGALALSWDNNSPPGSGTDLAEMVLTYPLAPFGDFDRDFVLSTLSDGQSQAEITVGEMPVQDFYDTFISDFVVQDRCINCHVEGGLSGHTRLVFNKADQPGYRALNLAQIIAVVEAEGADYPLNKVRGAAGHGGGIQLPSDSTEYADLVLLFGLMDETVSNNGTELFHNVELLPWDKTLRRAALIFAGRLPTESELATVRNGDENAFRATVRGLMQGEAFHQFLIEGANDRLLTDKWLEDEFMDPLFSPFYPEYNRLAVENFILTESLPEELQWEAGEQVRGVLRRASAREPLELIADIVEQDRKYTEVVTANHTMVNPLLGVAYQSEAVFDDSQDHTEWKSGRNNGQILIDGSLVQETVDNKFSLYLSGGIPLSRPHAGVLNTPAFLARYPSTATNRNRARSRWTYYFFLGVNIEKLAARTQDPDALADQNNPTMNNPNCTVCHVVMDPVAGAYQNYGDVGFYRDEWGGLDSLPETYKWSEDSPYQEGDTWYRDMRTPGFGSASAPDANNSIRWLGEMIAQDPRFASGTVKFWWPAVFGRIPLEAPEESSDADFAANLLAFETQNRFIENLAEDFRAGRLGNRGPYILKDMLVELVLSPWFRASGLKGPVPDEQSQALEAGYVGAEKLLTPEQLDRKTEAITGYVWQKHEDPVGNPRSGLRHHYRMYYGGIDSDGINRRSTEITSVMSNVVAAMAAEAACPITTSELLSPDSSRRLFAGLNPLDSPLTEAAEQFPVTVEGYSQRRDYSLNTYLNAGNKRVRVTFPNDYYDEILGDRNFGAVSLVVSHAGGQQVVSYELRNLADITGASFNEEGGCNGSTADSWKMNCSGFLEVPIIITDDDDYVVTVKAYGEQAGPEPVQMLTSVLDTDPYGQSAGANRIRSRLAQWHELFFGENVSPDGPEVATAYSLLVSTWQERTETGAHWLEWSDQSCATDRNYSDEEWQKLWEDPQKMYGAWRLVLTYFLTDYRYIFE